MEREKIWPGARQPQWMACFDEACLPSCEACCLHCVPIGPLQGNEATLEEEQTLGMCFSQPANPPLVQRHMLPPMNASEPLLGTQRIPKTQGVQ